MRRRALLAGVTAAAGGLAGCGTVNRLTPEPHEAYRLAPRLEEPLVERGLTSDRGADEPNDYLAMVATPAQRDILDRDALVAADERGAGSSSVGTFLDRTDLSETTLVVVQTCCFGAAPSVELRGVSQRLAGGTRIDIAKQQVSHGSGDANEQVPTYLLRIERTGVEKVVCQFPEDAALTASAGAVVRAVRTDEPFWQ